MSNIDKKAVDWSVREPRINDLAHYKDVTKAIVKEVKRLQRLTTALMFISWVAFTLAMFILIYLI